jgi:hypothetical protein
MSRCNPALRWGAGTTREKVADTAATREMEQRLAAMRRDRDEIDKMIAPSAPSQEAKQTPTCQVVSFQETSPRVEVCRTSTCQLSYGVACANTERCQKAQEPK